MEFIEAPIFTRVINDYLSETDYASLQYTLAFRPEVGKVIPKTGGIRKLRWPGKGRGKRGGLRIIYYWRKSAHEIWLLTLYAKNEEENLSHEVLQALRKEIES